MLHTYTEKEASSCLKNQAIIFAGDSVTRQLFYQVVKTLDSSLPGAPPDDSQKHADYSFETKFGTNITFVWDPFLNSSYTRWLLTDSQGSLVNYYGATPPPPPAMLVMGSGLWYLRYANTSGGIAAWEKNTERIFNLLTHSSPADSVVFLPVEQVVSSKLSTERARIMHPSYIEAMNSDLYHRINPPKHGPNTPRNVYLPLVFNWMIHETLTKDGLHFDDSLLRIQASILLNLHCNNKIAKAFPFDKTCCNSYPWANLLQLVFLSTVLLSGPYIYYTVSYSRGRSSLLVNV